MKKIFVIILVILGLGNANAQIQVQESFTNDLIILGNISAGAALNIIGGSDVKAAEHRLYCRIFGDKTTYGILVNTENRFDDDFEFALGTDIEKAKESIYTIIDFMKTKPLKTSFTVLDEDGRTIQINLPHRKRITLEVIDGDGKIIVNKVLLTMQNLERAIKLLDTKAEEKVQRVIERNNNAE